MRWILQCVCIDLKKKNRQTDRRTDRQTDKPKQNKAKRIVFPLSFTQQLLFSALAVPPEIRARGTKAYLAYRAALLEGKVKVRRGRLMLIGQDRAGKTSLKKSLLSLPFDPKEPSTDGVEVDPSLLEVEVDQVKNVNWKPVGEPKSLENQLDKEVARLVAEKLSESHVLKEKNVEVHSNGAQLVSYKGVSLTLFFHLKGFQERTISFQVCLSGVFLLVSLLL